MDLVSSFLEGLMTGFGLMAGVSIGLWLTKTRVQISIRYE